MAQKSKGMRRKTRKKLTKEHGTRGTIAKQLQSFSDGDQVRLMIDSSFQKGMPHPRFHGRVGTVVEQRGRSFIVQVSDGGQVKEFAVAPAHLTPAER